MTIRATDDPELAQRLGFTHWDEERQQFVPAPDAPAEDPEVADEAAGGQEPAPEAYEGDEWTQAALREACKQRGVSTTGTKEELAERLRKFDEFPPGPKD